MAQENKTSTRGYISRAAGSSTPSAQKKTPVRWKPAEKDWHPLIIDLYNSLKKSDHASEFQATDVALARVIAQEHSDTLYNPEKNAALIKGLFDQWKDFGVSVGSRRRLMIEAQKAEVANNSALVLQELARSAMFGNPGTQASTEQDENDSTE